MKKILLPMMLGLSLNANVVSADSVQENRVDLTSTKEIPLMTSRIIGSDGVVFFNEILKNAGLYATLLSLDSSVPDIARAVEYVAMLNEMHLINQELGSLNEEAKKTNKLLTLLAQKS